MFVLNEDNSIYATRGDIVFFSVSAEEDGVKYHFQPGDVVRIKVYGKKDAESVYLQKDFPVTENTEKVEIFLSEEDTKIGDVISKPKDYWYEVELNPGDDPQTFIGYDEDGAKVFKLFPEGADIEAYEPDPEDFPVVDEELDLTSPRPVANQAIAAELERIRRDTKKDYVTPQMFGAVGDGVSDDTEAIRDAISMLPSYELYFPAGTYRVTGDLIIDCDNAEICITDNATIICDVETPTGGVLQCIGYRGQANSTDTSPRRSGLHIYGGGKVISNDANTNAIGFGRWDNVLIENVKAESQRKGITGQFGGSNITVRDCVVYGNTIGAITFETEMDHIVIDNCVITADGTDVRNINIHSDIEDVVIRNCRMTSEFRNIRFNGVTKALVSGCVFNTSGNMNIDINESCDEITVENCSFEGSTAYGVYALNGMTKGIFKGNRIWADTGIYIASPAAAIHILDNYCTGVIYNVAGSGSVNPIADGNVGTGISGYAPLFGCNREAGEPIWYEDAKKRSMGGKPTEGTHLKGEIVYNNDCNAGDFLGWICTATGTPGTWKGFGQVES